MVKEVKTIRIRIPKEIWKKLNSRAIDYEVGKEKLANEAIKEWLARQVSKDKIIRIKKKGLRLPANSPKGVSDEEHSRREVYPNYGRSQESFGYNPE